MIIYIHETPDTAKWLLVQASLKHEMLPVANLVPGVRRALLVHERVLHLGDSGSSHLIYNVYQNTELYSASAGVHFTKLQFIGLIICIWGKKYLLQMVHNSLTGRNILLSTHRKVGNPMAFSRGKLMAWILQAGDCL